MTGLRIPVESDGISDSAGDNLIPAAVRIHSGNESIAIRFRIADIAGDADGDVQLLVGSKGEVFPSMSRFFGEAVGDDNRRRRVGKMLLDLVESKDAIDGRDVERTIFIGNPDRHL